MIIIKKTFGSAFLHYTDHFLIDWPAGSVAIVGPNGTGKTTAARALMWSLIGRFPTPPNVSKYTMDLPRPGCYSRLKKSPPTIVTTLFQHVTASGEHVDYQITRTLTADKKTTLVLESLDGVVRLEDRYAQNQIYHFSNVAHGRTIDECARLFMRRHWFGVDQDVSIFTASGTMRRELLESTNPLTLLPKMEEEAAHAIKTEQRSLLELERGISSCLGSVHHVWGQVRASALLAGLAPVLFTEDDLNHDAAAALDTADALIEGVRETLRVATSGLLDPAISERWLQRYAGLATSGETVDLRDLKLRDDPTGERRVSDLVCDVKTGRDDIALHQTLQSQIGEARREASHLAREISDQKTRLALTATAIAAIDSDLVMLTGDLTALTPLAALIDRSEGQPLTDARPASAVRAEQGAAMDLADLKRTLASIKSLTARLPRLTLTPQRGVSSRELDLMARDLQATRDAGERAARETGEILATLDRLDGVDLDGLTAGLQTLGSLAPAPSESLSAAHLTLLADSPRLLGEIASIKQIASSDDAALARALLLRQQDVAAIEQQIAALTDATIRLTTARRVAESERGRQDQRVARLRGRVGGGTCDECGTELTATHAEQKMADAALAIAGLDQEILEGAVALRDHEVKLKALQEALRVAQERQGAVLNQMAVQRSEAERAEALRSQLARRAGATMSAAAAAREYQREADARLAACGKSLDSFIRTISEILDRLAIKEVESELERLGLRRTSGVLGLTDGGTVGAVARQLAADLQRIKDQQSTLGASLGVRERELVTLGDIPAFLDRVGAQTKERLHQDHRALVGDITSAEARQDAQGAALAALEARLEGLHRDGVLDPATLAAPATARRMEAALKILELLDFDAPDGAVVLIQGPLGSELLRLASSRAQSMSRDHAAAVDALQTEARLTSILSYLKDARGYAHAASLKARKIEALQNLKTLLGPNGVARTMVLSSSASQAFDEANRTIKSLGLAKDLHVGVEVVSIDKEDGTPQPALDITFTVDGERSNLPSNSQGLQVALALDLAVQSQGGWGGFFIVDEPEQGLDTQTQGRIGAWLRSLGRQVIALTNQGADNYDRVISTTDIRQPPSGR